MKLTFKAKWDNHSNAHEVSADIGHLADEHDVVLRWQDHEGEHELRVPKIAWQAVHNFL